MRSTSLIALLVVATLLPLALGADDIVAPPLSEKGSHVALIFIQGAQIPPERYMPLVKAIQTTTSYTVWVGVPAYALDLANPIQIGSDIDRTLNKLYAAGLKRDTPVIYVGHSLGGVMLQNWLIHNSSRAIGQILMGSFLSRSNKYTFPIPTLTIGAELDGLARISRFAEAYFHQVLTDGNGKKLPIAIIEGMNHMQFASGPPPLLVAQRDLFSEISEDVAHSRVADVINTFVASLLGDKTAADRMDSITAASGVLLQPLVDGMVLESSYHIKPPCYDLPHDGTCTVGNTWSQQAQVMMAGLEHIKYNVEDTFHPVYQINPVHLPDITNNCTLNQKDCTLHITTVTENVYESLDSQDTGFFSVAASEMKVKMKSRQAVHVASGLIDADFNVTDAGNMCASINQVSYEWALKHANAKALKRFNLLGTKMVMGEDKGPYNAGPQWIVLPLTFEAGTDAFGAKIVTLRSPMMKTPMDFFIDFSRGFHYCKLLSPFKALEWIYVDGLRK